MSPSATLRVTVAIPTRNRAQLLRRCLQSVLGQSLADVEIFVSDNASTDETAQVVASFKDPRVHFERLERNIGLYGNVTRCLRLGKAPLIALLADDEVFLPNALARKVALLEQYPHVDMVHSALRLKHIGPDNEPLGETESYAGGLADAIEPGSVVVRRLLTEPYFIHATTMVARRSVIADDTWDEADGPACDLGFCLRVSHRSRAISYIAEPLGVSLVHPGAASIQLLHEFESGAWQPTFASLAELRHVRMRFLTDYRDQIPEVRTLRRATRRHERRALMYLFIVKSHQETSRVGRLRVLRQAARVDPTVLLKRRTLRYLVGTLMGQGGRQFVRRIVKTLT